MRSYLAWLRRRDWARWRALDPAGLQRRFEEWRRSAEDLERAARAQGLEVVRVELDPEEFAAWCRTAGVEPDGQARSRYAIERGHAGDLH